MIHPKQTKIFLMKLAESKECVCNEINKYDKGGMIAVKEFHRCFRCQLIEFLDSANILEEKEERDAKN